MLRQVSNPNGKLAVIFGILAVVGLLAGIFGFVVDWDSGIAIGIIGLVVAVSLGITAPLLYSTGKKQIAEMQALIAGHGLRAHWTFDQEEWQRYTENEYRRGMKQTRSVGIWTFGICFGLLLVISFFADALTALTVLIGLGIAGGMTALLAGTSYVMTRSAYATNRAGVGEVFIGGTAILFGTKFYSWTDRWSELEKVAFEDGNPSVVQFNYKVGAGDNTSHIEVRVPVPRGRESEATALVESYYAAS